MATDEARNIAHTTPRTTSAPWEDSGVQRRDAAEGRPLSKSFAVQPPPAGRVHTDSVGSGLVAPLGAHKRKNARSEEP